MADRNQLSGIATGQSASQESGIGSKPVPCSLARSAIKLS